MIMSFFRSLILFLVVIFAVRLMGKRQVGQMEPSEFVVAMLLADLAAIPLQDNVTPLWAGVLPMAAVVGAEMAFSRASMRWVGFRRLLCGKPVILIAQGVIQQENLRRSHITLDELTEVLRQQQILDLNTVQYAILETGGQVSVFPYPQHCPASAKDAGIQVRAQGLPVTLVSDGVLLTPNLPVAGKEAAWVRDELARRGCCLSDTFLFTVDNLDKVFFLRKDKKHKNSQKN